MGRIEIGYKGDMLFESKVGNHTINIDVPESMGGNDRGLAPPQLMLISYASCAAAFAARYCETAGLDATGMIVGLEFEKLDDPVRFSGLKLTIDLPNVADEKRKRAIQKSVEQCPVKATFEAYDGVNIEINLG